MNSTPRTRASSGAAAENGAGEQLDLMVLLPRLAQLGTAINRGDLVERAMEQAGSGLDRPAMNVLVQLRMADGPLRVGEIAHRMQVVGPHVTRQVNELERRRLVRRVVDPDDQRARLIEATAEGTASTERYLKAIFDSFNQALAGWSTEDRDTLGRLLGRFTDDLVTHLATLDAQDRGPGRN
ncbi:MarR family winged helix-turn-helix transcriptional regulator [Streptomyces sp. NPDC004267]|uniref:MarR family winged helix-turn-helix transcriptional regulator n=1 Tax=Streptomyces sp. NPDC004267 TaxID=3364694 RepID=UPI0036D1AB18